MWQRLVALGFPFRDETFDYAAPDQEGAHTFVVGDYRVCTRSHLVGGGPFMLLRVMEIRLGGVPDVASTEHGAIWDGVPSGSMLFMGPPSA